MQYFVSVSGNVKNNVSEIYPVSAKTEEEAKQKAISNFKEKNFVYNDEIKSVSYKREVKTTVATIILLAIPIVLSFFRWFAGESHNSVSISPDFISVILSLLLFTSFIVKFNGLSNTISSPVDIIFSIELILLFASIIRIFLINKKFIIPFINKESQFDSLWIIIAAIILSWIGIKIVSLILLGIVLVLATFHISIIGTAMGIFGIFYLLSAYIGVLMYILSNPTVLSAIHVIKKLTHVGITKLNKDLIDAKEEIASHSKKAIKGETKNEDNK